MIRMISELASDLESTIDIVRGQVDFERTAEGLVRKGWKKVQVKTPTIIQMEDSIFIQCPHCQKIVSEYSISPVFPDSEQIKEAVSNKSDTLWDKYCKHCGGQLR